MNRRLVAVVGATATGKTEVAAALAEAFDGEVVGADAFQVYRGLDIGTAKPGKDLLARTRHHLIDVIDQSQSLTLAHYLDLAAEALEDIWTRDRLPVLAGGSGQYVWALLEGWQVPRVPPDEKLREELEAFAAEHGAEALHARLAEVDSEAGARLDPRNVRRVVRALEVVTRTGLPLSACQTRQPIEADFLVLGLRCERKELHRRIDARVDAMFAAGLLDEVKRLREQGWGETRPVRSGIGYKEVSAYLDGLISLEEAIERTKLATHRLARQQGAWFKDEDPRIHSLEANASAMARAEAAVRDWLGR
jgi:tRNA dimethylallyltransferase